MANDTRTTEAVTGRGSPTGSKRPAPMRPNVWAVKDAVRIEDVARDYGEFRAVGDGRLLGRCLDPRHEDRTASMTIYADTQRFKCYGCGEHGDVIDLVVLAEGCETWEAMLILAQRYGVELPGRPDGWYRRQERQKPVRDALGRLKVEIMRRRLFQILEPMVMATEEELREEVAREVWAALLPQAERMVSERGKEGTP